VYSYQTYRKLTLFQLFNIKSAHFIFANKKYIFSNFGKLTRTDVASNLADSFRSYQCLLFGLNSKMQNTVGGTCTIKLFAVVNNVAVLLASSTTVTTNHFNSSLTLETITKVILPLMGLHSQGRLLVFTTNIRLGWKWVALTNIPFYSDDNINCNKSVCQIGTSSDPFFLSALPATGFSTQILRFS
jgi:hypothetical protein